MNSTITSTVSTDKTVRLVNQVVAQMPWPPCISGVEVVKEKNGLVWAEFQRAYDLEGNELAQYRDYVDGSIEEFGRFGLVATRGPRNMGNETLRLESKIDY